MLGDIHANVITVALVFLVHLGTICSAENDLSLVKLPAGEQTSDYVSWCFFSQHGNLTCNWTSSHRSAPRSRKQEILTSHPLAVVGKVCLEFWHLVSDASRNASVRALLNSSLGQLEIWTPLPLSRDGWRHVSVPLNITEQGTQVIFEAFRPLTVDQKTLRQIGVRKGSCRHQCESNAELWTDDTTRCLCSGYQFFCLPSQCPKDQTCDPLDGPRKISPSGVCTIHRNTDCHTFDGVAFRLMSPCTYVLAKTCTESKGLLEFYVEVVNVQTDNESLPTIQQINVGLGNVKASLLKGQMHRAV
ncbi:PREDICTED: uncharacterized protein LOC107083765, partial [Cyprinodon variegatus]|uniref:uncharacterized protein LOC107083765 n=1 Tax=Cyprinodon variegatus TaxID=28743 RepID=UPI0007424DEE